MIKERFDIAFVLGGNVASLIDKEKFKFYHCNPPVYKKTMWTSIVMLILWNGLEWQRYLMSNMRQRDIRK